MDASFGVIFVQKILKLKILSNILLQNMLWDFQVTPDLICVITVEIDIKKLKFLGRHCDPDTSHLTKLIFITRIFSYLFKNDIMHYGSVQDFITILMKNYLYPALTEYIKSSFSPKKHDGNGL